MVKANVGKVNCIDCIHWVGVTAADNANAPRRCNLVDDHPPFEMDGGTYNLIWVGDTGDATGVDTNCSAASGAIREHMTYGNGWCIHGKTRADGE